MIFRHHGLILCYTVDMSFYPADFEERRLVWIKDAMACILQEVGIVLRTDEGYML